MPALCKNCYLTALSLLAPGGVCRVTQIVLYMHIQVPVHNNCATNYVHKQQQIVMEKS